MPVTQGPLYIQCSTQLITYVHIRTKIILGLQSAKRRIIKCDRFRDCKVRQSLAANCNRFWITKCDENVRKWITKWDGITNRDGLQSDTIHDSTYPY